MGIRIQLLPSGPLSWGWDAGGSGDRVFIPEKWGGATARQVSRSSVSPGIFLSAVSQPSGTYSWLDRGVVTALEILTQQVQGGARESAVSESLGGSDLHQGSGGLRSQSCELILALLMGLG